MLLGGPVEQILANVAAADGAADLAPTRLLSREPNVDRIGLFVTLAGDAGANVSVTLRPVVVLHSGSNEETQFPAKSLDFTVSGAVGAGGEPVREYVEVSVPCLWKTGLRVTAISGTNAKVTVQACRGATTRF